MNKGFYFVIFIFALLSGTRFSSAQLEEYRIKSAFLRNFCIYTTWPVETMIDCDSFVIAVIGENPFKNILNENYDTVKIKNKPVKIKKISSVNEIEEIEDIHLLFISDSEKDNVSDIIEKTRIKPILTIADFEGAEKEGVLINIYLTKERSLAFKINKKAAEEAGLKISHHILRLAVIVK